MNSKSWTTFQNETGSSDHGVWHIAPGNAQKKIDLVKFQKKNYEKIEL